RAGARAGAGVVVVLAEVALLDARLNEAVAADRQLAGRGAGGVVGVLLALIALLVVAGLGHAVAADVEVGVGDDAGRGAEGERGREDRSRGGAHGGGPGYAR